jgi:membrane fusion protein (multidrug efflux system)
MLKIKIGQNVEVIAEAYPSQKLQTTVKDIAVKSDASKRFDVELAVNNSLENPLKAGMFGIAYFQFSAKGSFLAIPRKAIIGSIKDAKVYVAKDNKVSLKSVKTGITLQDKIEILEGLNEGEKVVITGQMNLNDGAKIVVL